MATRILLLVVTALQPAVVARGVVSSEQPQTALISIGGCIVRSEACCAVPSTFTVTMPVIGAVMVTLVSS